MPKCVYCGKEKSPLNDQNLCKECIELLFEPKYYKKEHTNKKSKAKKAKSEKTIKTTKATRKIKEVERQMEVKASTNSGIKSFLKIFIESVLMFLLSSFVGMPFYIFLLLKLLYSHLEMTIGTIAICTEAMLVLAICITIGFCKYDIEALREKIKKERETIAKNTKKIFEDNSQSYPWFATYYSDFIFTLDENTAYFLAHKAHPAKKAAETVQQISREKRAILKQCKMYEYQLNYYETIFPWLEEFKTIDPKAAWELTKQADKLYSDECSSLKEWLSPEEYNKLPSVEKYQRALDRYLNKPKSNWEVGRDFERYIGYLCEVDGYKVTYHGAITGLEDMGRDLIVKKDSTKYVIQCKRWAKEKTIHEKHIFQLYGSVTLMQIENTEIDVVGVFVSTCALSELARKCAEYLNIIVKENVEFKNYPLIKCNISKRNQEKIYHLPFDDQYDKVVIEPNRGEFYAMTVLEAEQKEFRHAWKWNPKDD